MEYAISPATMFEMGVEFQHLWRPQYNSGCNGEAVTGRFFAQTKLIRASPTEPGSTPESDAILAFSPLPTTSHDETSVVQQPLVTVTVNGLCLP